ncbi:hypothetical protein H1N69_gp59 [Lactococcus phage phiQ1]|uniref:Uncharacterized protein n=1 Tax=Lactococcus phage phiQ1 TaxID=2488571 RepID=A0A455VLK4_9CAUD|nr:hypothetical protein H1N69_gp59 [Lactococcus phage phiQ1]BBI90331.1 putative uncharacterized protein [Lactococcus phage phiQ1]
MKFKLSPLAPSSYTHAVITQGINGIRQRFLLNFDSDTVYDTADFESQYPIFTRDILKHQRREDAVSKTRIAEARTIYGQDLKVEDCGCSARSARMFYPLFMEVK